MKSEVAIVTKYKGGDIIMQFSHLKKGTNDT